ncbi:MAG: GAF domain-containing sensor histidine kinase [Chloroflexota bacterium]|nr:GAF domain-containing sensor histidine kinase [Chloroflexota bacterium]
MESERTDATTSRPEDALLLTERLANRTRELAILNAISEALNGARDVQTALENTLTLVAEFFGLRSAWVWLLDPKGRPFLAASRHLPLFLREPARMEGWLCLCLQRFTRGDFDGAANIDVLECSRLKDATSGSEGLRYHASISLHLGSTRVGVMNVAGPDWRRLSAEELQLLHTIGNQVAVAVERARLSEEGARAAQLEERNRLAREIHDTLAQQLAGVALHLETADAMLPERPLDAHERVRSAMGLVREGLDEARRSVQGMRAAPLEDASLNDALHRLAAQFTSETGVQTSVQIQAALPIISADAEAALYRITQEGLTNVRKHAAARNTTIRLDLESGQLRLLVRDDGRGFDHEVEQQDQGFGLMGMRERARLLGGDLAVESTDGRGTVLTVRLPLSSRQRGTE